MRQSTPATRDGRTIVLCRVRLDLELLLLGVVRHGCVILSLQSSSEYKDRMYSLLRLASATFSIICITECLLKLVEALWLVAL